MSSDRVYLAFGAPGPDGDADAFDESVAEHARRVVETSGVEEARCFRVKPDIGVIAPAPYTNGIIFTLGQDASGVAIAGRDTTAGSPEPGRLLADVCSATFYGYALTPAVELDRLDHMYLVFTRPPARVPVKEFFEWYITHARENLTAAGFDAAWRYRLEVDLADPLAPSDSVHAALYEVHGDLPDLRAALDEAENDGRVSFPEWFPEVELACVDCYATSPILR